MPDDRSHDHDLSRFWQDLIASDGGPGPRDDDLDPDLAETLRQLYALTRTPPPANVRARVDRVVLPHLTPSLNGKEPDQMQLAPTLSLPRSAAGANGWTPPRTGHAGSRKRTYDRIRPTSVPIATALLLLVTFSFGYIAYRDNSPAFIPPIQETSTAVVTPTLETHAWPMWGGDAGRTRNMPGPAPQGEPAQLWRFPDNSASDIGSIFDWGLVADGTLYVPGSKAFVALDTKTGRELWRTTEVGGAGVIDGDGIVLRSLTTNGSGYDLVRINRADGRIVWRAAQGQLAERGIPAISGGVGIVPAGNALLAFDPATGAERWRVTLDAPQSGGPAVAGGLVVVGDLTGSLYGISMAGGDLVWTHETGGSTIRGVSIGEGAVYYSTADGAAVEFVALDPASGNVMWRFVSPTGKPFYGPAISPPTVYVTGADGALYALDASTGGLRWSFQYDSSDANSPVLVADTVFLTGPDRFLIAVDASTGTERWRFALDGGSDFVPVVVDGVVYVGTRPGSVYAIGGTESSALVPSPIATTTAAPGTPTAAPSAVAGLQTTYLWSVDAGAALLAFPPDRTIWATDVFVGTVSVLDRDGVVLSTWGVPGDGPGQFNFKEDDADGWWTDYAFDADGSFWIAECGNERIEHFDAARNLIDSIGTKGDGDGQFQCPAGVVIGANGDLYVSDRTRDNVQRFKPDGTFVESYGGFVGPATLNLTAQGNLIVSDSNGARVFVLSPDGTEILTLGTPGTEDAQLYSPVETIVDDDGNFYVADQSNNRVTVFDPNGIFIDSFDVGTTPDGPVTGVYAIGYGGNGSVYVTVGLQDGSVRIQKYLVRL